MKARLSIFALLVAAALCLGGAVVTSSARGDSGQPDTYVASWDATVTQAFTAAALSPAEGHVIFAYLAIAAYDSVMAIDGSYQPFAVTPASGLVIARFLGTGQIDYTIPSLTGLGDRHFDRVQDLEYDVGNARIWGGIHFRTAVEDGIEIGKKTADQVLAHNFKQVD